MQNVYNVIRGWAIPVIGVIAVFTFMGIVAGCGGGGGSEPTPCWTAVDPCPATPLGYKR